LKRILKRFEYHFFMAKVAQVVVWSEKAAGTSTSWALAVLRSQLWGLALESLSFCGFGKRPAPDAKPPKLEDSLDSAVFYASG